MLGSLCKKSAMLSDTARKLLMIMRHSAVHHAHMPTLQELEIKSGRTPDKIISGLRELVNEKYIEWTPHTPPESARIIEGWERIDPRFKKRKSEPQELQWRIDGSKTNYWTDY